jgi:raffinose/stachyose/melibiose transport system permease protein
MLQIVVTVMVAPFFLVLYAAVHQSFQGAGPRTNYSTVLQVPGLLHFFWNSLQIALWTVALTYVCAILAAFALAKLRVVAREFVYLALVLSLTLPPVILTVPLFITMQKLGLFDSLWSVILPLSALSVPLGVVLARGFIAGIPDELLDAARVDGASTVRVFWHIILPLARPVSAVMCIWTFIIAWNEYLLPLLFLQSPDKETVTLLPTYFLGQYGSDYTKISAASVMIALPTLVVYIATQRYFERGMLGGMSR